MQVCFFAGLLSNGGCRMCIARTKAQGPEANSEEIICLNPRKPTLSKIRGAQRPIFSHGTPILQHSGLPLNLQHLSKFCLNVFRCDPSIKWGVQIVCCCCHDAKLVSPLLLLQTLWHQTYIQNERNVACADRLLFNA